jgi:hypothetical protein
MCQAARVVPRRLVIQWSNTEQTPLEWIGLLGRAQAINGLGAPVLQSDLAATTSAAVATDSATTRADRSYPRRCSIRDCVQILRLIDFAGLRLQRVGKRAQMVVRAVQQAGVHLLDVTARSGGCGETLLQIENVVSSMAPPTFKAALNDWLPCAIELVVQRLQVGILEFAHNIARNRIGDAIPIEAAL